MASSNFKLFDENKTNMMQDGEYGINNQRLNGLQSGIASSMLQNKFQYQMSLISYAIGQLMVQNNIDANDSQAVSTFVNNLSNTFLQKVIDKATTGQAQAGTDDTKWLTPALVKAFYDYRKASVEEAKAGTDQNKFITPYTLSNFVGEKIDDLKNNYFTFPNDRFKELTISNNKFNLTGYSYRQLLFVINATVGKKGSEATNPFLNIEINSDILISLYSKSDSSVEYDNVYFLINLLPVGYLSIKPRIRFAGFIRNNDHIFFYNDKENVITYTTSNISTYNVDIKLYYR